MTRESWGRVSLFCHAREGGHQVNSGTGNERVEVVPIRISLFYKPDLPGSIPLLQAMLTLNSSANFGKLLEVDQSDNAIPLGKAAHELFLVLVNTPDKVVRHPDVECAANVAGEDVHEVHALLHAPTVVATGSPGQAGR